MRLFTWWRPLCFMFYPMWELMPLSFHISLCNLHNFSLFVSPKCPCYLIATKTISSPLNVILVEPTTAQIWVTATKLQRRLLQFLNSNSLNENSVVFFYLAGDSILFFLNSEFEWYIPLNNRIIFSYQRNTYATRINV